MSRTSHVTLLEGFEPSVPQSPVRRIYSNSEIAPDRERRAQIGGKIGKNADLVTLRDQRR
jgi:hypothetical protein